jgi:hypothetical protein
MEPKATARARALAQSGVRRAPHGAVGQQARKVVAAAIEVERLTLDMEPDLRHLF